MQLKVLAAAGVVNSTSKRKILGKVLCASSKLDIGTFHYPDCVDRSCSHCGTNKLKQQLLKVVKDKVNKTIVLASAFELFKSISLRTFQCGLLKLFFLFKKKQKDLIGYIKYALASTI